MLYLTSGMPNGNKKYEMSCFYMKLNEILIWINSLLSLCL